MKGKKSSLTAFLNQADPTTTNRNADDWSENEASGAGVTNGCADRPCTAWFLCVPTPTLPERRKCVPYPIDCGQPAPPTSATVHASGTEFGSLAFVTCLDGFVMTPSDSPRVNQITCLVNARWSPFKGECVQLTHQQIS
ncbi:hypothetical protein BaRGS_00016211, partial [Batillaria attramentaria]